MVYTAESRSLAALEVLVHLEGPARGYSLLRCEFPETFVELFPAEDLPADWRSGPAPPALAAFGDAWITSGSSVVLAVPSAIVDGERNYLLNPAHVDFAQINILPPEPFPYDDRLVTLTEKAKRG